MTEDALHQQSDDGMMAARALESYDALLRILACQTLRLDNVKMTEEQGIMDVSVASAITRNPSVCHSPIEFTDC